MDGNAQIRFVNVSRFPWKRKSCCNIYKRLRRIDNSATGLYRKKLRRGGRINTRGYSLAFQIIWASNHNASVCFLQNHHRRKNEQKRAEGGCHRISFFKKLAARRAPMIPIESCYQPSKNPRRDRLQDLFPLADEILSYLTKLLIVGFI